MPYSNKALGVNPITKITLSGRMLLIVCAHRLNYMTHDSLSCITPYLTHGRIPVIKPVLFRVLVRHH